MMVMMACTLFHLVCCSSFTTLRVTLCNYGPSVMFWINQKSVNLVDCYKLFYWID